jgi:DNA primase
VSVKDALLRKPLLEQAVARYEANLDADAARYLTARGITKEAALKFRIGRCSEPIPEHEPMRGRLAIPYLTVSGPIGVKFRTMTGEEPKYMCEPGQPPLLFNARDLLRDADVLYVCEGELDAVVVSGVLGLPCVAFPGVSNWRPYYNRAVSPDWEQIYVIADGDEVGRGAARDIAKHLRARVIRMPDGHDLSSFYVENGRDETLRKLNADV